MLSLHLSCQRLLHHGDDGAPATFTILAMLGRSATSNAAVIVYWYEPVLHCYVYAVAVGSCIRSLPLTLTLQGHSSSAVRGYEFFLSYDSCRAHKACIR